MSTKLELQNLKSIASESQLFEVSHPPLPTYVFSDIIPCDNRVSSVRIVRSNYQGRPMLINKQLQLSRW